MLSSHLLLPLLFGRLLHLHLLLLHLLLVLLRLVRIEVPPINARDILCRIKLELSEWCPVGVE